MTYTTTSSSDTSSSYGPTSGRAPVTPVDVEMLSDLNRHLAALGRPTFTAVDYEAHHLEEVRLTAQRRASGDPQQLRADRWISDPADVNERLERALRRAWWQVLDESGRSASVCVRCLGAIDENTDVARVRSRQIQRGEPFAKRELRSDYSPAVHVECWNERAKQDADREIGFQRRFGSEWEAMTDAQRTARIDRVQRWALGQLLSTPLLFMRGSCGGCDRRVWGAFYCSERCRGRARRRRERREIEAKVCPVCEAEFTPARRDALTCSPACRQEAYRRRKRDGSPSGTPSTTSTANPKAQTKCL